MLPVQLVSIIESVITLNRVLEDIHFHTVSQLMHCFSLLVSKGRRDYVLGPKNRIIRGQEHKKKVERGSYPLSK